MALDFKLLPLLFSLFFSFTLSAQDSANSCKVEVESLKGKYTGKCKMGMPMDRAWQSANNATKVILSLACQMERVPSSTAIVFTSLEISRPE